MELPPLKDFSPKELLQLTGKILDELTDKLESRLAQSSDVITETLSDLLTALRVVSITGELKEIVADPDDDKVLECAVVANATHIVSGDRKHLLPLGSDRGIRVVSPAEFLRTIESLNPPSIS